MEKIILKAQVRTETGKRIAKDLRNKGIIPANVYKSGKEALSLQVTEDDLREVLHTKAGENVIITMQISGTEKAIKDKTVLIKEVQREPIQNKMLHVDFNEISLTETLKVNVPLVPHGESVGVKVDGGVLEHVMWELSIECLPTAIPEKIEVDITNLKIGDSVFVKNITVPEGVKVLTDPELIAMIVKPPKVEVAAAEAAVEGAPEGPELIRKKKEEAEEEGAEAPKKEAEKPATGAKEEKK